MWIAALISDIAQDITSGVQNRQSLKRQQKESKKAFESASKQYDENFAASEKAYGRQSELNKAQFNLAGKRFDQTKSSSVQALDDARDQTKSEWGNYLWGQKAEAGDAERAHDIKRIQRRGL